MRLHRPGSKETLASWAACDSAMGAQSCDEFNFGDTIEVCKVLPGSRADDEPCLADSQCASTRCAMIARPAENDPHPELYPCGTCQPRLQNGAPCEDTGDECLYGSFCVKSKCTPVIREGGACADSDGCGYNLRCLEGACRKGVPLGGACAAAADCMGWWAACTNGVCSEPSGIAQGQTCNVDGNPDQESCQVNTFCDGETRTCARPRVLGEACTSHDVCGYELSCQNGKCAALTDALCMQP